MAEQQNDVFRELVSSIKESNLSSIKNDQSQEVLLRNISAQSQAQHTAQILTAGFVNNLSALSTQVVAINLNQ